MDFRLSDEQELLRKSVREFAETEMRPHVMEWDNAQHFPKELLPKLAALGLMVPVLRHAEAGNLWGNASEISRLATAARSNKASREELSGSTITLTSLGALGGIVSTPVVNTPEVAIVGVNRMVERPMVIDGQIVVRKMMNLSSSFDHRVVDGMDAALFIQAVRGLLEQPACLFVE